MLLDTNLLLRRIAWRLAAVLLMLGTFYTAASAQDYEITPYITQFYAESGSLVTVKNLTVDTLEFTIHLGGDPEFTLHEDQWYPITDNKFRVHNLHGNNQASLSIFFKPDADKLSHAWLQIDHGTRSDTIYFTGQDTTYAWRSTADLKILGAHPIEITPGTADSVDFYVKYKNFGTTDMIAEMNIYNVNRGYSFNLVNPGPFVAHAGVTDSALVRFFNDKTTFPGYAILSMSNFGRYKDSVMLRALGPVKTAGDPPTFDVVPFYDISPNESECHLFTIKNPNDQPMQISGAYSGISSCMTLTDVTFPITVPAHGSRSMNVCLTVPDSMQPGSLIYGYFRMGYTDMLGVTTSTDVAIPAWIDPCFTLVTDSLRFEPTIVGGWVDADITITNNTSNALRLKADFETNNGRVYPVDKRQYISVAANSSATTTVRLIPSGTGAVDSWLRLNPGVGTNCSEFAFGRYFGYGVAPNTDSVTLDIFAGQKETIAMKGEQNAVSRLFKFRNNTGGVITVVSIALESGTHFTISDMSPSALPITLQPNELVAVTLEFDADTNGMYRDRLIVVTEGAATSQYFSIQGLQEDASTTSDVRTLATATPEMLLTPNPASGPITITLRGTGQAHVEIMNMLGVNMLAQDITGEAKLPTDVLANGTYIVRVTGYDEQGMPFITSRQVRIAR